MKRVFMLLAALWPLAGANIASATVTIPDCERIVTYGRSASPASDDVLKDFFGLPLADISSLDISTLQQAALDCSEDEAYNESNGPNLNLAIRKLEALRPLVQLFEDQETRSASTADTDPSCAALAAPTDGDIADTQFQQMARAEESGKVLANVYSGGIVDLYYARKKRESCAAIGAPKPEQNSVEQINVVVPDCRRFSEYGSTGQYDNDVVLKEYFGASLREIGDKGISTLKAAAQDCVRANSSDSEGSYWMRDAVNKIEQLQDRLVQIDDQNQKVAAAANRIAQLAKEVELLPNDSSSLDRLSEIDKEADRIVGWNSVGSENDHLLETDYNKVHAALQSKSQLIRSSAAAPQSQVTAGPASELTKFTDIERLAIALGVSWGNSMQMEKVRKALVENGVDLLGIVNLVTEVEDGWLIQITAAPGQQRSDDNGIFCFVKSDDADSVNVLGSLNLYSTARFTAELKQWDVDFGARRMRIVFSPCKVSAQ